METEKFSDKLRKVYDDTQGMHDHIRKTLELYLEHNDTYLKGRLVTHHEIGLGSVVFYINYYDETEVVEVDYRWFDDFDKCLEEQRKILEERQRIYEEEVRGRAKLQKESMEKFEREQYEKLKKKYGK